MQGGKETACRLYATISHNLAELYPSMPDRKLLIRVYGDQGQIHKHIGYNGLVLQVNWQEFVRGFNIGRRMCECVDAGENTVGQVQGKSICLKPYIHCS